MIKILIVDDQIMIREGVKSLLEPESDFQIVGDANNGKVAIEQIEKLHPDIVLIDIQMPEMDGLAATKIISQRFPFCKPIVLSSCDNQVAEALEVGAKGYLLKDIAAKELASVIRVVQQGFIEPEQEAETKQLASVKALVLDWLLGHVGTMEFNSLKGEIEDFQNKMKKYLDEDVNKNFVRLQAQIEENNLANVEIKERLNKFSAQQDQDKQSTTTTLEKLSSRIEDIQISFKCDLSYMQKIVKTALNKVQLRLNVAIWIIFLILGALVITEVSEVLQRKM